MRRRDLLQVLPAVALPSAAARAQPSPPPRPSSIMWCGSSCPSRRGAPATSWRGSWRRSCRAPSGRTWSWRTGAARPAISAPISSPRRRRTGTRRSLIDAGILATAPSLFTRLPFDPKRDLQPATMLIFAPYILAVHPSLPVKSAAELAAFAKAQPRRVDVAHSGIGAANHLTALILTQHWGADGADHGALPRRGGGAGGVGRRRGEHDRQRRDRDAALRAERKSPRHRGLRHAPAAGLPRPADLRRARLAGGGERHLAGRCSCRALRRRPWSRDGRPRCGRCSARPEMARRMADLGGEVRTDGAAAFREMAGARDDRGAGGASSAPTKHQGLD